MKDMRKIKWHFILVSALTLFLLVAWQQGALRTYFATGGSTESALLREGDADAILKHTKSLSKDVVLVNFWASWCLPCKKEFPHILELKTEYSAKGFDVVFVSIDGKADREAAE